MTAEDRLICFQADLSNRSASDIVQRYVTYGECYALSETEYISLKQEIAQEFNVHPTQVVVVGSAKLGFSIVPDKRFKLFGETSDIDVAFCSSVLFDEIWRNVYDYWRLNGDWTQLGDFRKYLFRGWMRPDKLPPSKTFIRSQEWWDFFRRVTASGKFGQYSISGALYKDWHFLETYQSRCVLECQRQEKGII